MSKVSSQSMPAPFWTIRGCLPKRLRVPLFGDRDRYGLEAQTDDAEWREWEDHVYLRFYDTNQKESVGAIVNNAGYRIMSQVDLTDRDVLELGPGDVNHIKHWQGKPSCYRIGDVQLAMLDRAAMKLAAAGIDFTTTLLNRNTNGTLPFGEEEFDVIVSFYSLEHLYPLESYLSEMLRVLKRGGLLVGAIPTEGGLAWGLGRFLTSRRWLKKHTSINPDKLVCWEHPNYSDFILKRLAGTMDQRAVRFWPLVLPSIDMNLVVSFIYAKR